MSADISDTSNLMEVLKHTRLIHFTLTILSVTVLYVGIIVSSSGDNPITRLNGELQSLRNFILDVNKSIKSTGKSGYDANRINPQWYRRYYESTKESFDQKTLAKLTAQSTIFLPTVKLNEVNVKQIDFNKLLLREIDEWVTKYKASLTVLDKPIEGSSRFNGLDLETVHLDKIKVDWQPQENALVTFNFWINGSDGGEPKAAYLTEELTFSIRKVDLMIPSNWKERFGNAISTEWNHSDFMTFYAFQNTLKHRLNKEIEAVAGTKLPFVGMTFASRHVGAVGPIFIVGVMIYLSLFLKSINKGIMERKDYYLQFSPVIIVMPGYWAKTITFTTICILPTMAVSLILYTAQYRSISTFGIGGALFIFSYVVFLQCLRSSQLLTVKGNGVV